MLFDNNTKQDTVSPLLVADVSCTCVYLTHDCLVVDLDHLVSRVDLLTLVCWRLHRRKEREREGVRGSNCYCGRWWRCSCCVCEEKLTFSVVPVMTWRPSYVDLMYMPWKRTETLVSNRSYCIHIGCQTQGLRAKYSPLITWCGPPDYV